MGMTPKQRESNRLRQARYKKKGPRSPSPKVKLKQDELCALLAADETLTLAAACARIPITTSTEDSWRRLYPSYHTRITYIMAKRRGEIEIPPCPFSEESRAKYFASDYDEPINPRHLRVAIDFINSLEPGEFGLITFPPEHAKTSLGEDWLCCSLADDPETRAVVISKTQNDATNRTLKIQARMEDEDFYGEFIRDFGPFKPEGRGQRPWAATKMTIARKTPKQRDYSLQALGVGAQVQGKRIDKALLDDVVDDENYREYESQSRYIRQSVNTRLGKTGVGLMIGTRQDEMDLYKYLTDEGFFDKTLILPAVFERDYSYTLSTGEVISWEAGEGLWPERYSDEDYAKMEKKAGPRIWALTYQQQDVVTEGQAFPLDLIELSYDTELRAQEVPFGSEVVVGIDPAAQGYTAGVALGIDPTTGMRTVIDVWNEKGLIADGGDRREGVVQFILELCRIHGASRVVLEDNSAFVYVSSSPRLRSSLHEIGCALETVRASRQSHHDEAMGHALSTLFTNGTVRIPAAGTSKSYFAPFIRQLSSWRPHDKKLVRDMVRAFYYAEIGAQHIKHRRTQVSSGRSPDAPTFLERVAVA